MGLFDLLSGDGQIGPEHFAHDRDTRSQLPIDGAAESPKATAPSAPSLQALREIQSILMAWAAPTRRRSSSVGHSDVALPDLALVPDTRDDPAT